MVLSEVGNILWHCIIFEFWGFITTVQVNIDVVPGKRYKEMNWIIFNHSCVCYSVSWSGLLEWQSNYHYNSDLCMCTLGMLQSRLEKYVVPVIVFIGTKSFWSHLLVHNQNIRYFSLLVLVFPIFLLIENSRKLVYQGSWMHIPGGSRCIFLSGLLWDTAASKLGSAKSAVCCYASSVHELV